MIRQIKYLSELQLKNLYGLNVFKHTKDKKVKQRTIGLGFAMLLVVLMMVAYIGMAAYGYIMIGMAEVLPAYLIMLSSLVILFFTVFKAGSVIFQRNAYDILCSLPVSQTAIVVSRFIRMYVENLLLTVIVMLPGIVVYGGMVKPRISFYLIGCVVTIFIPLIPITIATFLGALVTAIASRMKHKSLVSATLMILLVVGIMLGTSSLSTMEDQFNIDMLQNLSKVLLAVIAKIYPPAIWFGTAMVSGDFFMCLAAVAGGIAVFIVTIALVSAKFHAICRSLYSTTAKHNYRMEHLKKTSVLGALYQRELKRYFASSVYVTNTIVGPISSVIFSGVVFGMGLDTLQTKMELPIDIEGAVPFLLSVIFCVMTTTCTSVSMEGKEWWIVKSLPVRTKELLDSKLLLGLSLAAPFYVVSEILLIFALKPNFIELMWFILVPAICILFSNVFGITINLKIPVFNWENETTVVKQSAAAMVGGLGGCLIVLICMFLVMFVPAIDTNAMKLVICLILAVVTACLYRKNNTVNLQELG